MAKEALEQEGHTVIEFKSSYNLAEAVVLGYTIACAAGQMEEY